MEINRRNTDTMAPESQALCLTSILLDRHWTGYDSSSYDWDSS